jgi:amino acid transporter
MSRDTIKLRHEISAVQLFTLAFGTMVGAGWVILVGGLLESSGSMGAILGLCLGAALMVLIAVAYAEVMSMYPVSGGEFAYAYLFYGERAAFVVGWLLAFAYIAVTAFEIISVGWLVCELIPGLKGGGLYSAMGAEVMLSHLVIGFSGMILIALANLAGTKVAARLQDALVFLMIGITLAFGVAGVGAGEVSNLAPYWSGGGEPKIWGSILAVVAVTPFWFAGFDVLPQAMGEKCDNVSASRLFHIMAGSIIVALLFYCLVLFATSMSEPRASLLEGDLVVVSALQATFESGWMRVLVLTAALLGLLSTWNAIFFAAARLVYALGSARLLPASFGRLSKGSGAPSVAIVFCAASALALAPLGRGGIGPIVGSVGGVLALVFLVTLLGIVRHRITFPKLNRPFRAPIILLLLAVVSSGFILFQAVMEDLRKPQILDLPPSMFILMVWLVLGVIYWILGRSSRREVTKEQRKDLILSGGD